MSNIFSADNCLSTVELAEIDEESLKQEIDDEKDFLDRSTSVASGLPVPNDFALDYLYSRPENNWGRVSTPVRRRAVVSQFAKLLYKAKQAMINYQAKEIGKIQLEIISLIASRQENFSDPILRQSLYAAAFYLAKFYIDCKNDVDYLKYHDDFLRWFRYTPFGEPFAKAIDNEEVPEDPECMLEYISELMRDEKTNAISDTAGVLLRTLSNIDKDFGESLGGLADEISGFDSYSDNPVDDVVETINWMLSKREGEDKDSSDVDVKVMLSSTIGDNPMEQMAINIAKEDDNDSLDAVSMKPHLRNTSIRNWAINISAAKRADDVRISSIAEELGDIIRVRTDNGEVPFSIIDVNDIDKNIQFAIDYKKLAKIMQNDSSEQHKRYLIGYLSRFVGDLLGAVSLDEFFVKHLYDIDPAMVEGTPEKWEAIEELVESGNDSAEQWGELIFDKEHGKVFWPAYLIGVLHNKNVSEEYTLVNKKPRKTIMKTPYDAISAIFSCVDTKTDTENN